VRWALLLLALAFACCGGDGATGARSTPTATETVTATATPAAKVAGKDCSEVGDLDAEPERQPPADVTVLDGARVFRSEGETRFYAAVDGTPAELGARRDDAQNLLVQNSGYASLETSERPTVEATAHLEGPDHTVDLRVTPLCTGKLELRYVVRASK
jgi:hypothetical protein